MNVLVACEFSGVVRDAFIRKGHNAWSCDIKATESVGPHFQEDVLPILDKYRWDLLIAHPPCTYLCNSSSKHLYIGMKKANGLNVDRFLKLVEGANFFRKFLYNKIPKKCVENPIMLGYAKQIIGKNQTQTIQPYQFGHFEKKATCLWLDNLPPRFPPNGM